MTYDVVGINLLLLEHWMASLLNTWVGNILAPFGETMDDHSLKIAYHWNPSCSENECKHSVVREGAIWSRSSGALSLNKMYFIFPACSKSSCFVRGFNPSIQKRAYLLSVVNAKSITINDQIVRVTDNLSHLNWETQHTEQTTYCFSIY